MKRYVSSLPFSFYLTCSLAVVKLLDNHLYFLSLGNWFHLHPGSGQHSGEWQHHTHRQKVRSWVMRPPGDSGFCYSWGSGTKGTLKGVSNPDNNLATVLFIRGSCHSYPMGSFIDTRLRSWLPYCHWVWATTSEDLWASQKMACKALSQAPILDRASQLIVCLGCSPRIHFFASSRTNCSCCYC